MPIISQKELDRLNKKQGVYANLNKPTISVNESKLKQLVTELVEKAFKEYVRKHKGMTKADEDKFWKQFRPILMRYL